ncbi:putative hyaluronan/mRNA-binding protein [Helianthus anomalus]
MKSHPHPERPDRLRAIAPSLATAVKEARNDASHGGRGGGRGYGWGRGVGDRPRRPYERGSGTCHGNKFKLEGPGRLNWGSQADEITRDTEEVKTVDSDKPLTEEESKDEKKENVANESEKEHEDKHLRLKKGRWKLTKSLHPSMQQLSNKKSSDGIFAKLGTSKDKRKEIAEKEEKA